MKILLLISALLLVGCNTQPMPNITIGGSQASEGCIPGDVTINLILNNDKAVVGKGDINDDDSGLANPTLGLQYELDRIRNGKESNGLAGTHGRCTRTDCRQFGIDDDQRITRHP